MTNPTSNFGWQMPTSTDLVTDLPADFETFGQAVDTSLADLKGGTSGQILAKASNTDMDFTWVTNDVGDITAVTAGTGITGGGTSGAVTVSFDQANYGGGQYAAGKNKFLNADFAINQRAFTSSTISATMTIDKFQMINVGGGDLTVSTQTFGADAPVPGYDFGTFIRLATTGTGDASSAKIFRQKIENVANFANQTVTISFYAKASTGTPSVAMSSRQIFGTGGSTLVETHVGKTAITSSWARYSFVYAVPSISGKTVGAGSNIEFQLWTSAGSTYNSQTNSLGTQNVTIDTWGWQIEAGSIASPFQIATGNPQSELAACQRYYVRFGGPAYNIFTTAGFAASTTVGQGYLSMPVQMRVPPTAIDYAGTIAFFDSANGSYNTSSLALDGGLLGNKTIGINGAITGATQGRFGYLRANNDTNAYVGLSAEL